MTPKPGLRRLGPRAARAAVLVLHGGEERSKGASTRLRPAYLRMVPFARDLREAGRDGQLAVYLLCHRYRGWNAPELDAVTDARWALGEIRRAHPGVPVAVVGHSMGGRTGLLVADDPAVVGVCALAPWTPEGEPVGQLAGRTVLIAHGDRDTMTEPALSLRYAERAKQVTEDVCRFDVVGEGHAMLRRYREWALLVRRFTLGVLALAEPDGEIAAALAKPALDGLRVPR